MALTGLQCQGKGKLLTNDEDCPTNTTKEQIQVEQSVLFNYESYLEAFSYSESPITRIPLLRHKHVAYLKKGLSRLSESYECLDASRPWLCYWILQGLTLLGEPIPEEIASGVASFLGRCQDPEGGFAGGPGQLPHLAPTYAAVLALCILGKDYPEAYDVVNREKLQSFLDSRRMEDGSFTMHKDGEVDIRGAYCAIVAAQLTNVCTHDLFKGTAEWLVTCQTYEGGFGGCPGMEAHGGYSFCGFAALALLGQEDKADIDRLLRWVSRRQMKFEGGFQGRTNKLVDGCYSFWQGGLFIIIHNILAMYNDEDISQEMWMFDQVALQEYVLINCQHPGGGLVDKPGKSRDFYHTCYCLSGLSLAQNFVSDNREIMLAAGGEANLLKPTHPIYNIGTDMAFAALEHYRMLPIPTLFEK